ncbi:hypothetical protein M409DRAFT_18628 [Zasmidium cellare ATCC 36951]|uniref:Carboxypeptidase n=1 Tax=Zasmidium cellare ATCC 36951 TaxID=1080233 RepID=A0A6A6CXS4_ZASCE|nr:uncharacterized protein M409DRAFT_18628 [Zasmidium cellare ATCC 36951]KAF2171513.1 hypothetical protein M409DRAFT_18628 [Zasmidium cellare ATCC 36951]
MNRILVFTVAFSWLTSAQFPPIPDGLTVIHSQFNDNVTISYKEASQARPHFFQHAYGPSQTFICETTPGVRSFAGYVHLPPYVLAEHGVANQSWPINTFFWFFEARRRDPQNAPLLIWINGGPGASSSGNAFGNVGPCKVHSDTNSTYLNEWSWNNEANLMFIDQPVQVGLSYDTLQNITYNRINGNVTLLNDGDPIPEQNNTLAVGTWPSTDTYKTSFGSIDAAYALWHFAQAWFQEFPEHEASSVSLSGVSYGGKYGPAIFNFFEEQNQKIRNGTWKIPGEQYVLPLDTLIIDSGCIDLPGSWFSYPEMAVNNTYGIRAVNDTILEQMLHDLNREGGCLDQAYQCGNLSLEFDPFNLRLNESVNRVCNDAGRFCDRKVQGPYGNSERSFYDITVPESLSRAPPFTRAYLLRPHVQQALGMRVNWTSGSAWVGEANQRVGDFARPGWIHKLEYRLEKGIKVAFVYGDKDYICNWLGGEAVSLAINSTSTTPFPSSGYEDIHTNASYIGGTVRQYGPLSFSRVYQAGHGIAGLQPETAFRIIERAMAGVDIATGTHPILPDNADVYQSKGLKDTYSIKNEVLPTEVLQVCYLLDVNATCTDEQKDAIANGTAVIREYMLVDKNSTARFPQIVGSEIELP